MTIYGQKLVTAFAPYTVVIAIVAEHFCREVLASRVLFQMFIFRLYLSHECTQRYAKPVAQTLEGV